MAYLILAHRDMEQLGSLVARLLRDDPDDRVVIHYDRGSPVSDEDLQAFAARFGDAVSLVPRIRCLWGHHSQIEAEWRLKKAATELPVDYAHLISGQDWPVADKGAMVASIEPGAAYVSFEQPDMTERMDDYHFHDRMLGPNPHPTSGRYHLDMNLRRAARLYTRLRGSRPALGTVLEERLGLVEPVAGGAPLCRAPDRRGAGKRPLPPHALRR
jgi:hypothetical protein